MSQPFDAIIITADEPYGQMWHTQVIYADHLAKFYRVIYIEPQNKWSLFNIIKRKFKKSQRTANLSVYQYPNILPSKWNSTNDKYLCKLISSDLKQMNAKSILIWHFDSFRSSFSHASFTSSFQIKRVYHVIDPFYKNPLNTWLSETANVLILTSPRNNEHYEKYQAKIINIPQCLDMEQEKKFLSAPAELKVKFKPGYSVMLGTISDVTDFVWLNSLLEDPDFKLVLMGQVVEGMKEKATWENMLAKQNVHYLGLLKPREFYPVIKHASCGLIIYNEARRTSISSPLKVMNYFVAGIPVISNTNCEIEGMNGDCLFQVKDVEETKTIVKAIHEGKVKFDSKKAEAFLQDHTIDKAVEKVISKLSSY